MALTNPAIREDELVRRCIRGERVAQRVLYDRFSSVMYPLCCRYLKDRVEAEDVMVTAFMKVFEKISHFRGEGSLEGWIKRVMINESLTFLRKKKALFLSLETENGIELTPATHFQDHLEAEDLHRMISELPPGYRVVFNLYAIDGYSHKEIAEQLNISENTSKSQLSRARTYLQKKLAQIESISQSNKHDLATR